MGEKTFATGIEFFQEIIENDVYYVDKTLLIKELVDSKSKVVLFCRPRRFGKTLNMTMLRSFFSIENAERNGRLFKGLKIEGAGERYMSLQGRHPVVFLTLKDVNCDDWASAEESLKGIVAEEFTRHAYLLDSAMLDDDEKNYYRSVKSRSASTADFSSSLRRLCAFLHRFHGAKTVLLIDEYDAPIQSAYERGYYDRMISFMRNWLGGGLKTNESLQIAVLTGVLRVSKESVFSGLNNLSVNTVLDREFSGCFGFTQEEVDEMARYAGREDRLPEIKRWYDGYMFGGTEIYNPWSVVNYFGRGCEPRAYWVNTSGNAIVKEVLDGLSRENWNSLFDIMNGKTVSSAVETDVVYGDVRDGDECRAFGFLLMTGYLKAVGRAGTAAGHAKYDLRMPNMEINEVYRKEIIERSKRHVRPALLYDLADDLIGGDAEGFSEKLGSVLKGTASFYDSSTEGFYHGLVLGMTAAMNGSYVAESNRESGKGRFDIAFIPKTPGLPGVIIELKKAGSEDALGEKAAEALRQIGDREYETELKRFGAGEILKYGVAFCGKEVRVAAAGPNLR